MTAVAEQSRQTGRALPATALAIAMEVLRDPRTSRALGAAPRVGAFLARSSRRSASSALDDSVVPVRTTPIFALEAYIDELVIALLRHPDLFPKDEDFRPAGREVARAHELFQRNGWIENPAAYHRRPVAPADLRCWQERAPGFSYERMTFTSGFEIQRGEPGRDRWLRHEANRTVHGWMLRAPGADDGTWLVCAHGFGMGSSPYRDLRAFRAAQMRERGISVVVPVLPLHGPRASGRVKGEDLMTIDMMDSLHGVAQGVWDLRRVVAWLRDEQGAKRIGLIGYSFGALVAALVASLETDLACVIAGIPVVDLPALFRRHSGARVAKLAESNGVLGREVDELHRVASPLAMECKVPVEHRYLFAGLADRMSTFGQARRLWLHWDRPKLAAYQGGHVGFYFSRAVRQLVDGAVAVSLQH